MPLAPVVARLEATAPPRLGVAVSGGSDSLGVLMAAMAWAEAAKGARVVEAATVDHRLRVESADEAQAVAALCVRLGIRHEVLAWDDAPGRGNAPAAARAARTALLSGWAARRGLGAVALGHTLDDQAETLVMRLARGSRADGLSAMREVSRRGGALWLRPALGQRRQALRAALRARGVAWVDDPSNADPSRDRTRVRAALEVLEGLGIGPERLAETAARLASEADALQGLAADLLAEAEIGGAGEVILDRARWRAAPAEVRRRALGRLLRALAGAAFTPRHASLAALDADLLAAEATARTLHGCAITADAHAVRIWREAAAGDVTRWTLHWPGRAPAGHVAGVLGEAGLLELSRTDGWTSFGAWAVAPRCARAAAPAAWVGARLVAAPLAGYGSARVVDRLSGRLGDADAPDRHGSES